MDSALENTEYIGENHPDNYDTQILNVDEIQIGFYPRKEIDEGRIKFFASLINDGEKFPEIDVVANKKGYFILDGAHRFEAYKQLKLLTVKVKIYNIQQRHWLLTAAARNLKSSKPLTKEEVENVIIEAFSSEIPVPDIADIIGYSNSLIYKIIKPYKDKEKERKKDQVIALRESGLSQDAISEETGIPRPTIHKWVNQDFTKIDMDAIAAIEMAHSRKLTKIEKNLYICISDIKRDTNAEKISKRLGLTEIWVRNTALILIYIYYYHEERDITIAEIVDFFDITEEKAYTLIWFFSFKGMLPERKFLLEWIDNNQGKYDDDSSRAILRFEKLYWHKKTLESEGLLNKKNNDQESKSSEIIIEDLKTAIKIVKSIEPSVKSNQYDEKMSKVILEHINRMQIYMNRASMILKNRI